MDASESVGSGGVVKGRRDTRCPRSAYVIGSVGCFDSRACQLESDWENKSRANLHCPIARNHQGFLANSLEYSYSRNPLIWEVAVLADARHDKKVLDMAPSIERGRHHHACTGIGDRKQTPGPTRDRSILWSNYPDKANSPNQLYPSIKET